MDTSIITPEVAEDAMGRPDTHQQVVVLYRRRLAHLLQQQPADDDTLSHAEQRQLLGRAVMTTIETLTQLGDGAMVSHSLRQARRRP